VGAWRRRSTRVFFSCLPDQTSLLWPVHLPTPCASITTISTISRLVYHTTKHPTASLNVRSAALSPLRRCCPRQAPYNHLRTSVPCAAASNTNGSINTASKQAAIDQCHPKKKEKNRRPPRPPTAPQDPHQLHPASARLSSDLPEGSKQKGSRLSSSADTGLMMSNASSTSGCTTPKMPTWGWGCERGV